MRKLLAWAQRNERHLGALVFVAGFATDLVAFLLLDVSIVAALFAVYLALAALAVLLGHALASRPAEDASLRSRTLAVLLPLAAQYLVGNLLSGFLIFYTKSADPFSSWPFLLLLAAVFVGNEWFRKYKDRIAFMAVLLFFAAYAYAVFALPLVLRALGPTVFLWSTGIAVGAFALFMLALWTVGRRRLVQGLAAIWGSVAAIVAAVSLAYFTGLVPPIPLALKDAGVFHEVRRVSDGYVVRGEPERPWWDPRPETVNLVPGAPLYAFAAVSAPVRFGTTVVHRWQRYDEAAKAWVDRSRIAFPISGGRAQGYRGYTRIEAPEPGAWRVRIETEGGQVIGRIRFDVEAAGTQPLLEEGTR